MHETKCQGVGDLRVVNISAPCNAGRAKKIKRQLEQYRINKMRFAIFVGFLPQLIAIGRDYLPSSIGSQPGLEPLLFGFSNLLFQSSGTEGHIC